MKYLRTSFLRTLSFVPLSLILLLSCQKQQPAPEPEKKPMTREEALKFPIPIRGQNFGVPLGEMFAKKPGTVKYYAEEPRYAGSELQEAAKLVVQ